MALSFSANAAAALVFLVGYVALFLWMARHYLVGAYELKSRWTILFIHILTRIASQACAIAFSIQGFENRGVFVAFLYLEGYITLVLCAFRFLIAWHRHNLPSQKSWLDPETPKCQESALASTLRGILVMFFPIISYENPMAWFNSLLVYAYTAIIVGGNYFSSANDEDKSEAKREKLLNIATICRTTAQSVFLLCSTLLLAAIVHTIWVDKIQVHSRGKGKAHPTLIILLVAWFPLIIRGVWGVLQAASLSFSYSNVDNQTSHGFTPRFATLENVLELLMQWIACMLIAATFYSSRHDAPKVTLQDPDSSMVSLSLQAARYSPDGSGGTPEERRRS